MPERPPIQTASHKVTNDKAFELITARLGQGACVLDLGAGHGHLARRVGSWLESRGMPAADHLVASDLVAESFEATEIPFQRIDFNDSLPFDDEQFDVVYSIEVMEHLHRPYDTLRECFRVLKPGGWLIVSTPNILHLQSRFRFLFTGFWSLYQPPSSDPANAGRICGHVMPLHLAYYAYGLRLAGFADVGFEIDRVKRGANVLRLLFAPFLSLMRMRFNRQVARYDPAVYEENREILDMVNGPAMMTSRSLMFVARRPSGASV